MRSHKDASRYENSFEPLEGGYLYYPSRRSGGKFVTNDERQHLLAEWERITNWRYQARFIAATFMLIFGGSTLAFLLSWPEWIMPLAVLAIVIGLMASLIRAARKSVEFVRSRPDIAPPRPIAHVRRLALLQLRWSTIAITMIWSGYVFASHAKFPPDAVSAWLWMSGSICIFALSVWIAALKALDWFAKDEGEPD